MKDYFKYFSVLFAILILTAAMFNAVSAQDEDYGNDDEYYEDGDYENEIPFFDNALLFNLSYGSPGFGVGAGYRYKNYSAQLGLSGFANNIPNYNRNIITDRSNAYSKTNYTTLILSLDFGYHYNFNRFTAFGTIGYYSKTDTVLAKKTDEEQWYVYSQRPETSSGIAFSLGGNYAISDQLALGLAYHTQHGAYIQVVMKLD